MTRKIIWLVVLVIVLLLVVGLFKNLGWKIGPNTDDAIPTPTAVETTLEGVFTCLPHRDSSGPQTMECAFGLKADDGKYYALDLSSTSQSAFDQPMNTRFSVTGILVKAESLNTDFWQKYDIVGIMKVESYEELSSGIPTEPVDSDITLELNKPVNVASTTIRVTAVTEDSRCPSDVQCIQAGRAVVALSVLSPSGASSKQLEIGGTYTTESLVITLIDVKPYPNSKVKTTDSDYRFTLSVKAK